MKENVKESTCDFYVQRCTKTYFKEGYIAENFYGSV